MDDSTPALNRRSFLKMLGAASLGGSWLRAAFAADPRAALSRPIPSSGEQLPVIGMGTSRTFDAGDNAAKRAQLLEVLQAFFAGGGTLIDSSPMYKSAEEVTGALLAEIKPKPKLFSATKVWIDGKQAGIEQMERSRKFWGVERFDLIQIHNLRDWQVHLETLKAWKAEGKVRYIGITTSHGRAHDELEQALRQERFDFAQFTYNLEEREVERRLLPLAADRGVATLINRPFGRGDLFAKVRGKPLPDWAKDIDCATWAQFFLKFVVSHPAVTCAIPATSKAQHMIDNMGAGFGRLPDAKLRSRMIDYLRTI
ncbi:MAG: aldo/keto reductase [Pseudomonadota bacterium]|nr:MAG: aldo/keto reductase [Pseudomonadota bacterium]